AEIGEILGSQVEITLHRLRALEQLGILRLVENPFETHVSVADHRPLDELPEEVSEAGLQDAVEDFKKRQSAKADEMVRLFEETDEEAERRQTNEDRAEQLRNYRPPKPKTKAPWEE
ncbi:MAG TPA: hypothetical protein VKU85_01660, partial [bacterium]|nr:hypothetical protein [bacterium]